MMKSLVLVVLIVVLFLKGFAQADGLSVQPMPSLSMDTLDLEGFERACFGPADPAVRVVGVGATSFTLSEGVRFSNKLIQWLVLERGFRTIALLRDDWALRAVNVWLKDAAGGGKDAAVKELVASAFHGSIYATEETVALLRWLKDFNLRHTGDPVVLRGLNFTEPMSPAHLMAKYVFPNDSLAGVAMAAKRSFSLDDGSAYADIVDWVALNKEGLRRRLAAEEFEAMQTDLINLGFLRKWPAASGNYFDSCLALTVVRLAGVKNKLIVCADNGMIGRALMRTDQVSRKLGGFLGEALGRSYWVALTDYYQSAALFWYNPAAGGRVESVRAFSDKASTAVLLHADHAVAGGMVRFDDLSRAGVPIWFNVHSLYSDRTRCEVQPGVAAFDILAVFANEHPVTLIR